MVLSLLYNNALGNKVSYKSNLIFKGLICSYSGKTTPGIAPTYQQRVKLFPASFIEKPIDSFNYHKDSNHDILP